jgi:hypothetical protein
MSEGQSKKQSVLEACTNILIGYTVNFCANLVILPLVGFHINLLDNFYIVLLYTAVSLVRQYVIRRLFNRLMVKLSNRIT